MVKAIGVITGGMLLAMFSYAADGPSAQPPTQPVATKPATAPSAAPVIRLDDEDQRTKVMLNLMQQNLNAQFEQLRMRVCWKAGLRPDECGQWVSDSAISKVEAAKK